MSCIEKKGEEEGMKKLGKKRKGEGGKGTVFVRLLFFFAVQDD